MAVGNGLGFTVNKENILNFDPASIVVESNCELPFEKIGMVSEEIFINGIKFDYDEIYNAYTKTLDKIYPLYQNLDCGNCEKVMDKLWIFIAMSTTGCYNNMVTLVALVMGRRVHVRYV